MKRTELRHLHCFFSSNAQQEPGGGNGICQDIFQLVLDLVDAILPAQQAAKYQCLLNALCM